MPRKKAVIDLPQTSSKKVTPSEFISPILETFRSAGMEIDFVDAEVCLSDSKAEAKFVIKARGFAYAMQDDEKPYRCEETEADEPIVEELEHPEV